MNRSQKMNQDFKTGQEVSATIFVQYYLDNSVHKEDEESHILFQNPFLSRQDGYSTLHIQKCYLEFCFLKPDSKKPPTHLKKKKQSKKHPKTKWSFKTAI